MMKQRRARWAVVALLATLALSGCAKTSESKASEDGPVKLVKVKGSDIQQVVLTAKAARRVGIQTVAIAEKGGAKVAPYAAVVYDANGAAWAYTRPKPFTFVRSPITVESIAGNDAILSAGPDAGTAVVTVGTAELFGSEQEIGH
jgi:hypothetical protein